MLTVDYLALLEQGVHSWNHWRSEHPEEYPALEAAYLFGKTLRGINLRNVNLSRACLIGADLAGADLTGADLTGVYASNANFQGAILVAADLRNGSFVEANFSQANLSQAWVEHTNLTDADFTGACLEGWSLAALSLLDVDQLDAEQQEVDQQFATQGGDESRLHPQRFTVVARSNQQLALMAPGLTKPLKARPRLSVALGIGAIAITTVASVLYLTNRSQADQPAPLAGDRAQIPLVCREPEPADLAEAEPDYTYQDGTQFYGKFVDGQPANGRGIMIYDNGNRYDGQYRKGQRNGCGTFTFQNGRRYVGEFKNDLFSGRGVWILENGDRYIGDFEYNKCNGEGIFIFADGSSKSGVWQQGRLVDSDLTCDRNPINEREL